MTVQPIESTRRIRNMLCAGVSVAGVLFASAIAVGDPIGAGSGTIYRLGGASSYVEGCFPPCLCPIMDSRTTRGTLELTYGGADAQAIHRYAVNDVNWTVPAFGAFVRIVGSGTYHIGSPDPTTVLQHRMALDLAVGDGPVEHYDSGWVPIEDLTGLFITVSINGMYCWDRVIAIDARVVSDHELRHYQLVTGSTYQHGCFDPCDCILEAPRPLVGAFDLIEIFQDLFETQFALVNLRWQVLGSAATDTIPVVGFGVFRMGGDFAFEHQLSLELIVGDSERTHFDSGVLNTGAPFPRIDEIVSVNGIECLDTVLHVIADPAADDGCGGIAGIPCTDPGEFCKLAPGQCCCDFMGVCTPRPDFCPTLWDPVCGCDGVTYGNECEAEAVGVSISHRGACEAECKPADDGFGCVPAPCSDIPEEMCIPTVLQVDMATGAITTLDCTCLDFNFCHIEFGNASPFAVGYCPDGGTCTVIAHDSNGDGVDDWFTAACAPTGVCCTERGSITPLVIPECTQTMPQDCGGTFQGVGTTCAAPEPCCMTDPLFGPHCVLTDPACCIAFGGKPPGPDSTCGGAPGEEPCVRYCRGWLGDTCMDGEFCKFYEGVCTDAADASGVCTQIPTGCPDVWLPVCGCDGVTYGNECEADAVGVSVLHQGECEPGACCLPQSPALLSCLVDTRAVCDELGGKFLGPGTSCPTDPSVLCGTPDSGACCHDVAGDPNSSCIITTEPECGATSGVYFGHGTVCPTDPTVPCGPHVGACCVHDPAGNTHCIETTDEVCLGEGGEFLGNGSTCPPDGTSPCDPVFSACCLPDGRCLELPLELCLGSGGAPLPGVLCDVVFCTPLDTGACCHDVAGDPDSWCIVTTEPECFAASGVYFGHGTDCPTDPTVPCGPPSGACCVADPIGTIGCFIATREVCHAEGGEYQGDDTTCPSDANLPCGSAFGACCLADGSCLELPTDLCEAAGGSPLPGASCAVVDCAPDPIGACCLPNAAGVTHCIEVPRAVCHGEGGEYQGDGTTCSNDTNVACPAPSACCLPNGGCLHLPPTVCLDEGGEPRPNATCDAVHCGPSPTGACCFPAPGIPGFACRVTTAAECLATAGEYRGDGTSCPSDPSAPCGTPCDIPCPTGQHCFRGCGTVIQGVTCILFEADSGDLFLLSDPGGLAVGDRALVTGCVDLNCYSDCMQGNACLDVQRIESCAKPCGGIAGIPCDNPNDFCKFPEGTCIIADMAGACTPIGGNGCPEIYAPVCGCDGVTYVNECESDAASVSILHRGPCDTGECAATRVLANADTTEATYCPGTPLKIRILLTPPDNTSAVSVEDAPPSGWAVSNISHSGTYDAANGKVKWGPLFPSFPTELTYEVMPTANAIGPACFTGAVSIDGINRTICGEACLGEACCPRMSSDVPQAACDNCPFGDCNACGDQVCGNGHVTICELTGYACAWLTGCHDDMAGVTRAAYIWHNGECYCWDDAEQNWFPTPCDLSTTGCCDSGEVGGIGRTESTGTATLLSPWKGKLVSRDTSRGLRVSVQIEAPAGTSAVSLEVAVPQGWRITDITDDGTLDGVHGKIKWGPYLDNLSRTVSFMVSPTRTKGTNPYRRLRQTAPTERFVGTVSFDGINQPIEIE